MTITVYADFTCPLTFLVHQRALRLEQAGLGRVHWRAVVADPRRPVTGQVLDDAAAGALRETVRAAAQPDERVPVVPARLSGPVALASAYAEAVTDGVEDALREELLSALWERGEDLSDATDVRRVVADVMIGRPPDIARRLPVHPVIPLGIGRDEGMRRAGATTTRVGGPVTGAGHRRLRAWERSRALRGAQALPLLVTELGETVAGAAALGYLLRLVDPAASLPTRAAACPERTGRQLTSH